MKNGLKELIDEILSGICFIVLFFLILFGGAFLSPLLEMLVMHSM